MQFKMLSFLIVMYVLTGVQGKAFPSRYKRDYEASYHYIPFEEGILQLSRYSPEVPNYHDYVPRYAHANEHDWSAYYHQPMVSQPPQNPYTNINDHHKMKAEHTWHFFDQNHVPVAHYLEGKHLETDVETPNVVEALVKKDVIVKHGTEYDTPIVVEALVKRGHTDQIQNPAINEFLTIEEKPIKYKYDRNPFLVASTVKHPDVYEYKNKLSNLDPFTKKRKPSVSYDPAKLYPFAPYVASEHVVEVDSVSKTDKPVKVEPSTSYNIYEPIKEVPFTSSIESELPAVVDSLSKKDKPVKVKPSTSYNMYGPIKEKSFTSSMESELPAEVDFLSKKEKPVKVKPSTSYNMYEPIKEVPFTSSIESELPAVVDSLSKKDKPVKVKPSTSYDMYEPIKEVPFTSSIESELPVVVDYSKKDKPSIDEPESSHMYKLVKGKPLKDRTAIIDAPSYSIGYDSFYQLKESEHETPVIVEALVRREEPKFHVEEFEMPVVVEALVRRHPTYENKKMDIKEGAPPKNLLHPVNEPISSKDENINVPVIEALTFEEGINSEKNLKKEEVAFDETRDFNDLDMDENEDHGSAMDFDQSRFARSLPANLDIFSTLKNVKEKEKLKFRSCVTPKNETGNCMPVQQCSVSSMISNIDELLRNVCRVDDVFIGVCCPEFPVETVRVDWEELKPNKVMLNEEKSSQILKECGRLPLSVTNRDSWPWMASLIAKSSDKIFCGGALIKEQYVLTAAHCTIRIPRNQILVRLGRPSSVNRSEPDFEVIEIKRHAGYNPKTMQNDIALLKLSRRVQIGDVRRVVCLSEENESIGGLVNASASLLSWKETPGEIKDVEPLLVISPRECQSRMRTAISDSILCTEPRTDETMCNADSGAPLIIDQDDKFRVIGVLTWNRNDCDERFPTVFTRISSYHRWIEKLAS